MPSVYRKDPDALLDYKVDWTLFLGTDHIVSAQTSVRQSNPTATSAGTIRIPTATVSSNNLSHIIWASAGTVDYEYTLTSRIWTSGGRRNDQSFIIRIESL